MFSGFKKTKQKVAVIRTFFDNTKQNIQRYQNGGASGGSDLMIASEFLIY